MQLTESCKGTESSLAAGSWCLRPYASLAPDFNMQAGDPQFLKSGNNIVGREHGYPS